MTLRKGEFWTCWQCTLRNPLDTLLCQACKARSTSQGQPTAPSASSRLRVVDVGKNTSGGSDPARSPSPRHGKQKLIHSSSGGAIPKQVIKRNGLILEVFKSTVPSLIPIIYFIHHENAYHFYLNLFADYFYLSSSQSHTNHR